MKNNVKEAVKTLCEALKSDQELFYAYQANIAMQFSDEYNREREKGYVSKKEIHIIANNSAKNFLNLLINQK